MENLVHSGQAGESPKKTSRHCHGDDLAPRQEIHDSISKVASPRDKNEEGGDLDDLTVSHDEGVLDLDTSSDVLDSPAPSRPRSSWSRSGVQRGSRARSAASATCSEAEPMTINVEIARRNAEAMKAGTERVELDTSMSDIGTLQALRGKANTPASLFTDFSELKALEDQDNVEEAGDIDHNKRTALSVSATTPGAESRHAVYCRAVSLMTQRCPTSRYPMSAHSLQGSRRGAQSSKDEQQQQQQRYVTGPYAPQSVFIQQTKPAANIPPLQAWKGYHGNVYFEPIKVNAAQYAISQDPQEIDSSSEPRHFPRTRGRTAPSNGRSMTSPTASDTSRGGFGKCGTLSRGSTRSSYSRNSTKGFQQHQRKMAILDKKVVLDTKNDNIHEDIVWIAGQESTGSLSIQSEQPVSKRNFRSGRRNQWTAVNNFKNRTSAQNGKVTDRTRICKGSVVNRQSAGRNGGFPLLSVTGDRFTPPQIPSPLLRTQTQYSESSQRAIMNSPDPYHIFSNPEKLPPLEQLRASLRHIDNSANQGALPVQMIVPPLERMKFEGTDPTKNKPFVKYSAEVRNSATAHSLRAQRAT